MKTEYEKMRSQELYYFSDPEIHASLVHAKKVCARLRSMTIYDEDYRQVIEELIPGIPQILHLHRHALRPRGASAYQASSGSD